MKTSEYSVSGLVNSQSKTKLLNSLDKIVGVQEVVVDIARGRVEVEYNEPATQEAIRACIEKTGYQIQ
jgi:copper chaperone